MWAVSKHHGPFITTAHVRARSLRATVYKPTSTCATPERSDAGALRGTNPQTQSCWNLNIPRGIPTSPGVEGLGRRATPVTAADSHAWNVLAWATMTCQVRKAPARGHTHAGPAVRVKDLVSLLCLGSPGNQTLI